MAAHLVKAGNVLTCKCLCVCTCACITKSRQFIFGMLPNCSRFKKANRLCDVCSCLCFWVGL